MKTVSDAIIIGRGDVDPSAPSHVPGVHEGNWHGGGNQGRQTPLAISKLHRSTGINPKNREPIDPRSPKLGPP
jgi:hypothetical protein